MTRAIPTRRAVLAAAAAAGLLLAPSARAADAGARALASLVTEHSEVTTTVSFEAGVNTRDGRFQKSELIFEPKVELSLPAGMALTAIARLRYDPFERLEPGDPAQPEISSFSRRGHVGDHVDVELREFYLEATLDRTYLTLGKQQIVWGKADGLKVLDVVNPQDFREFVLDDFEDSRIPLWAVNVEMPVGPVTAQLVWLPDPTYHDIPEEGALYEITSERLIPSTDGLPAGIPLVVLEPDRPRNLFYDSDAGLRLSTFYEGWDLTFNYLYHYYDTPALERRIEGSFMTGFEVVVEPRYKRTHLFGATFSNAWGDLTVRGEAGYSTDRWFSIVESDLRQLDEDGLIRTGEISYVLGFDWFGFENTVLSLQIFQSILTRHREGMLREEEDENVSFLFRRTFLNETLLAELILVHNRDDNDGFVRPKLTYDLNDETKLWAGMDLFYGDSSGIFGQFGELDRVVFGVEWAH